MKNSLKIFHLRKCDSAEEKMFQENLCVVLSYKCFARSGFPLRCSSSYELLSILLIVSPTEDFPQGDSTDLRDLCNTLSFSGNKALIL